MESLTPQQAKEKVEKAVGSWEVFADWMIGQTGPIVNGKFCYYTYDVDRFIRYKCNPNNEPPEEWD